VEVRKSEEQLLVLGLSTASLEAVLCNAIVQSKQVGPQALGRLSGHLDTTLQGSNCKQLQYIMLYADKEFSKSKMGVKPTYLLLQHNNEPLRNQNDK
jgi:hypothetical protein